LIEKLGRFSDEKETVDLSLKELIMENTFVKKELSVRNLFKNFT